MENAIIALISIAIILSGTLTLVLSCFPTIDMLSTSWKQMTQQAGEMRRTEIAEIDAAVLLGGTQVEITIRNDGEVTLSDFDSWDVIVQYGSDNVSYSVEWLSYTATNPPQADNQWTVSELRFNGNPETIEPNMLNPGEEMEILMQLNTEVGEGTTNWATISTPNGVATQVLFQRGGAE